MDVEKTIVNILASATVVTSLIGPRLCPNHARQGTDYPFATYEQSGGSPVATFGGPSKLTSYRMTVQVASDTYGTAKAAMNAIAGVLSGLRGQLSGFLDVRGVFLESGSDSYDPPVHDDDVGVHTCSVELLLWYIAP